MHIKKSIIFVSGAMILALALLALTPTVGLAQSEDDPSIEPGRPVDGSGGRRFFSGLLTRTFRYQQSMVKYLNGSLRMSESAAERAQNRITNLEAEGEEVGDLEAALEEFNGLMGEAQAAQDEANRLVILHAGFDRRGRVEELAAARETVSSIEPLIRTVRENLVDGFQLIFEAIREFAPQEDNL